MWTAGEDRISHSNVYTAFAIKNEPMPVTFTEWCKLTAYERQPFKDWKEIVLACLETDQMADCPSFKDWMGPIEGRHILLNWARKTNKIVMDNFTKRSLAVKARMEGK
jgi:hypothetical protein